MTALPSTEDLARLAKAIPDGPWLYVQNHPTNACAHVLQDADWPIEIATLYGNHDDVPHPPEGEPPWGDMPVRDATAEAIALLPALLREVLDRRAADRWSPATNILPWCALTIDQMRAFESSTGEIQRMGLNGEWIATDTPLSQGLIYRIHPHPTQPSETVADCEEVAFALWCEEAGNTTLRRHRTRKAWDDQSEDIRERFLRFADAALRALKGGEANG